MPLYGKRKYGKKYGRGFKKYYKRKYKAKARQYKRQYGIGRGAHNYLASRPGGGYGVFAPETYADLNMSWMSNESFVFPVIASLHQSVVNKNSVCVLALLRPAYPKDLIMTLARQAQSVTKAFGLNGIPCRVIEGPTEENIWFDTNAQGPLDPVDPATDNQNGDAKRQQRYTGNKPANWDALTALYDRCMAKNCRLQFTLINSGSLRTHAHGKDHNDTVADQNISLRDVSLSNVGQSDTRNYLYVGCSILHMQPDNSNFVPQLPKSNVNSIATQEGTVVKLMNLEHGNSSVSLDMDIDQQKWVGHQIDESTFSFGTSDSNNRPPTRQAFVIIWVAPVLTHSTIYDMAIKDVPTTGNFGGFYPNFFDLHIKATWPMVKFYRQKQIETTEAVADVNYTPLT